MRIVGILLSIKSSVTHLVLEPSRSRNFIAHNSCCLAKIYELPGICPAKILRGRIYLVELTVNAKSIIIHKSLKISSRFHSRRKASGIMVPHVDSCLIYVGCPAKGIRLFFQYKNREPALSTIQRCI